MAEIIRMINLALYFAVIALQLVQWRNCGRLRPEMIGWLAVGVNGALFYLVLTFDPHQLLCSNVQLNTWSSTLRLQTLLTLASIEVFRWLRLRGNVKIHGC